MEKRIATIEKISGRHASGYAARFNTRAKIGSFTEEIKPGAFDLGTDILCLLDHNPGAVLGRTKSGTLNLRTDDQGLFFELDLPDTAAGRDVQELAKRGDLGGMSFGFNVPKNGEVWEGSTRTLTKIDLREISIISAWPAYPETSVKVRGTCRDNRFTRFLETI
ncbi:MAG: HK97 family phage prohead protease [Desulfobacteraceae bacterium]|nr:HK97 family phage prohead protease [Desulfobacteraceae bacterium]